MEARGAGAVFGAMVLAGALMGAGLATAGGGTAEVGAEARRDGGAVFWVFVSLPHPTTTSRPYLTHAACEAARRIREPRATMGCHLEPLPETGELSVAPPAPRGHP